MTILEIGFIALTLPLAALAVAGATVGYRAGGGTAKRFGTTATVALGAWLAATYALAARGLLTFMPQPPTMIILLIVSLGATVTLASSGTGRRIALGTPLAALVAFQTFRLPLELLMHRAWREGLMPVQMTWTGRNFDVVTAILAIPVAFLVPRIERRSALRLTLAWNILGSLLLANVLVVAILSLPTPLRFFMNEPSNVWITRAPFVWLPSMLVPFALFGHIAIFRRLAAEMRSREVAAG